MWRLPTNFSLSYNLLPCLSLTRSRRAWMEEWLCPSHCLICLGKALTSNTNLNDSSGNLGSVSEARLGLAQWPSLREHGKFAGSICHGQHELRNRTRKEWLNGLDPWLALVDVRRSAAPVVLWDYRKLYQAETLAVMCAPKFAKQTIWVKEKVEDRVVFRLWKHYSPYSSRLSIVLWMQCSGCAALQHFRSLCMGATSQAHQWRSIKPGQYYTKWQSYDYVRSQTWGISSQASCWIRAEPIHWKSAFLLT